MIDKVKSEGKEKGRTSTDSGVRNRKTSLEK